MRYPVGRSPISTSIGRSADGVTCTPLIDALAVGPEPWDALVTSSATPSPFMRWAWHDAWARAAPEDVVRSSFVLEVRNASAGTSAAMPLALRRMTFRHAPVTALTWAIRGVG